MKLSNRYSCQKHGKNIEAGCVACEVYADFKVLDKRIEELEALVYAEDGEKYSVKWALEVAENKRLRSELKAAGKGAERNAHINVMLVDENKRLRERMEWMLEYIYSINPRCDTESKLSITEIQGWFDDQGKVRGGE